MGIRYFASPALWVSGGDVSSPGARSLAWIQFLSLPLSCRPQPITQVGTEPPSLPPPESWVEISHDANSPQLICPDSRVPTAWPICFYFPELTWLLSILDPGSSGSFWLCKLTGMPRIPFVLKLAWVGLFCLQQTLPVVEIFRMSGSSVSFFFLIFVQFIFLIENDCFTILCWFLPCVNVNQPCVLWTKMLQLRPTLRPPMDCSLPGSSAHGILQARTPWNGLPFPPTEQMASLSWTSLPPPTHPIALDCHGAPGLSSLSHRDPLAAHFLSGVLCQQEGCLQKGYLCASLVVRLEERHGKIGLWLDLGYCSDNFHKEKRQNMASCGWCRRGFLRLIVGQVYELNSVSSEFVYGRVIINPSSSWCES